MRPPTGSTHAFRHGILSDCLDDLLYGDLEPPHSSLRLMAEQACTSSPGVPCGEYPATSPGLSSPPGPGCGRGVSLPQEPVA